MAIREIRKMGDPVLRVNCKEIKEITPSILELIDDMFDTMYDAEGVGLAGPQVGIRKRICVVDVGIAVPDEENPEEMVYEPDPLLLINPVILESSGEQTGSEGCLSVPGKSGIVKRANYVKVKAYDENMEEFIVEATELKARAIQHEMDHLDGVVYVDRAEPGTVKEYSADDEEEE